LILKRHRRLFAFHFAEDLCETMWEGVRHRFIPTSSG